ncbi:signal transduction histidine kinase [Filimonas zeae]|uniref:sensor histidine kinase n=1 Tax=Filimonas zeae TaxID=1737353 RepID=UPI00166C3D9D|nr:sensor histidine kinase [Filimonas zeae]MDR6342079.1 signal transduction histidine kinase [Filimonas zeae]
MRRAMCWILLLTGIVYVSRAQQTLPLNETAYTDSLNKVLQTATTDSTRARVHYQLSEYWRAKDTVQSKALLQKAKQLAGTNGYVQALYPFYLGQYYFNTHTAQAAVAFQQAQQQLAPFTTQEAYLFAAMAWFNYGIMLRAEKGDDFVTDIWLNKAIPLAEKSGNEEKAAHFYTQLATLLMYNARFDKAALYNNKAIALLEKKYPTSSSLMFAYLSAASNYLYSNKSAQAKPMLDKAWELLKPFPQSVNLPNYYYTEALYYTTKAQFGRAMESLNKGIPLAQQLNQQQLLQMMVFRKYNILYETGEYTRARQLLTDLLQEGTLGKDVNNRKTIYQQMATVNEAMGQAQEANRWLHAYSKLNDSLHESKLQKNIQELEIKFNKAENEKKIAALHAANEKATLSARNTRLMNWLLAAALALLLAIAAIVTLLYRNQRRQAKRKELDYQRQLINAEQQKQIQVRQALIQGEENERERLARDLHDGLGGMLAGIKLNLATMPQPAQGSGKQELSRIINQLDNSSTELRRIAHNMMPQALLSYGLEAALRDLCDTLATEQLKISFHAFDIDAQLPRSTQKTIYRIVQEMLSNVLRHANATEVLVQCSQAGSAFFITVEDNGKGFDKGLLNRTQGIGLTNIQKRVDYLNGKMEIEATVNAGTTINIELNVAG